MPMGFYLVTVVTIGLNSLFVNIAVKVNTRRAQQNAVVKSVAINTCGF